MILDTVKTSFNLDALIYFDKTYFKQVIEYQSPLKAGGELDVLTKNAYALSVSEKITGLSYIYIDLLHESVLLEFSAKILLQEYLKGISLNTYDLLFENINSLSFIKIDKYKFYESANIHRCDITKNLYVSRPVREYIQTLALFKLNSKYKVDVKQTSVIFKRDVQGGENKAYNTYYDKETELNLAVNRNIIQLVPRSDYENNLRDEVRLSTYKAIKNYCGVEETKQGNIKFKTIIESKENVTYKLFKQQTEKGLPDLNISMSDKTIKEFWDCCASQYLLNTFDADITAIMLCLKPIAGHHLSQYRKKVQKTLIETDSNFRLDLLKELDNLIAEG